jgi:hypothetical protein
LRSEAPVFVGGVVTGPLFGWLGWRWGTQRAVSGPLFTATAFCLEPLAHAVIGRGASACGSVAVAEVLAGLAAAVTALLLWRNVHLTRLMRIDPRQQRRGRPVERTGT